MKTVTLLQVITIFCFRCTICYKSVADDHKMPQLIYQCCASSVYPTVRALRSHLPVRAHTSRPRLNSVRVLMSAPKDLTHLHDICGLRPKLSTLVPVFAQACSCSGWRPEHCYGQPPQIANCHVGGQQQEKLLQ